MTPSSGIDERNPSRQRREGMIPAGTHQPRQGWCAPAGNRKSKRGTPVAGVQDAGWRALTRSGSAVVRTRSGGCVVSPELASPSAKERFLIPAGSSKPFGSHEGARKGMRSAAGVSRWPEGSGLASAMVGAHWTGSRGSKVSGDLPGRCTGMAGAKWSQITPSARPRKSLTGAKMASVGAVTPPSPGPPWTPQRIAGPHTQESRHG